MKKQELKWVGVYETQVNEIDRWLKEIKEIEIAIGDCKNNKEYQELSDKRFITLLRLRRDAEQLSTLLDQEVQICKELNL
ncbi:MAG: hypothetical protein R3Y50_05925 [Rikenellaceae bacterium]